MTRSSALLIQKNVPLADKNWFRTGGAARYFCEPENPKQYQEALAFAATHSLEIFLLGEGANILVNDDGFDGLVIRPKTTTPLVSKKTLKHSLLTCSAGLSMNDLIEFTLANNLTGLEVFSGIPGTVGGSTYINLHYFTHFLSDFVTGGHVVEKATGKITHVTADWFAFGYNQSTLIAGNHFLIDVTLQLTNGSDLETAYARGRRFEIIRHRASRYPQSHTCGSFFRNFHEDEVTLIKNGKKMIYVAFYLDKIGVKGTETVGDACVSWQHANMLFNKGGATSQDIINLARTLQEKVYAEFQIIPQPECIFVGFKHHPLHTSQSIFQTVR